MPPKPGPNPNHVIVDDVLKPVDINVKSPLPLPVVTQSSVPPNMGSMRGMLIPGAVGGILPITVREIAGEWINVQVGDGNYPDQTKVFWVHVRSVLWTPYAP